MTGRARSPFAKVSVLATALLVSYLANVFIRAVIERVSRFR